MFVLDDDEASSDDVSVESDEDEWDVDDFSDLNGGALVFGPTSSSITLKDGPEFERNLVNSAKTEIRLVHDNLKKKLEPQGLDPNKVTHVLAHFLNEPLTAIIEAGKEIFYDMTKTVLSFPLALSCVIFRMYLGMYNISATVYFDDVSRTTRYYTHVASFPSADQYTAFCHVLEEAPSLRKERKGGGFKYRDREAMWNRPEFKRIPHLFQEVTTHLSKFAEMLALRGSSSNFSSTSPLNFVVDDLLIRGGGLAFFGSYFSCRKILGKAKHFGPQFSIVSTCFARLPLGVYCVSRFEKESGVKGSSFFQTILEETLETSGIEAGDVRGHFDRGYPEEVRASIRTGIQVEATLQKGHSRNKFCHFTFGLERRGNTEFEVIPLTGPRRAWYTQTTLFGRTIYQLAYRDRPNKVVTMLTTSPDHVRDWLVLPEKEKDLHLLLRSDTQRSTLSNSSASSAPEDPSVTQKTEKEKTVKRLIVEANQNFSTRGEAQRTPFWRLHRTEKLSSTTVIVAFEHVACLLMAANLVGQQRTLLDVVQNPVLDHNNDLPSAEVVNSSNNTTGIAEGETHVDFANLSEACEVPEVVTTMASPALAMWGFFMSVKEYRPTVRKSALELAQAARDQSLSKEHLQALAKKHKVGSPESNVDALRRDFQRFAESAAKSLEHRSISKLVHSFFGTFKGTSAMREGTDMEPAIRKAFITAAPKLGKNYQLNGTAADNIFAFMSDEVLDYPMVTPSGNRFPFLVASVDGIVVSGATVQSMKARVLEFKLFQAKEARADAERAQKYGECCGFDIVQGMTKDAIQNVVRAFASPDHFVQTLHHMAVTSLESGVYCCSSADDRCIKRLVVLNATREFLRQYCECTDSFAKSIFDSGLLERCTNEGDMTFTRQMREQVISWESTRPLGFREKGAKPALVVDHNRCKCAQDILQKEFTDMTPKTSSESSNERMFWTALSIASAGAFRVWRCYQVEEKKTIDTKISLNQVYDALNAPGSVMDLIKKAAEDFRLEDFGTVGKALSAGQGAKNVDQEKKVNPHFRPESVEWRSDVTRKAGEVMKGGKKTTSMLEDFVADDDLDAARLGVADSAA